MAIASAPIGMDVAASTQWSMLFLPTLGPLHAFLATARMQRAFDDGRVLALQVLRLAGRSCVADVASVASRE